MMDEILNFKKEKQVFLKAQYLDLFSFLLYINDLPEICGNDADIALFADDTSLIKIGKRDATDINSEHERVRHWFCQNKLTLNTTKCESKNFAVGKKEIEIFNSKLPKLIVSSIWVSTLTISSHSENTLST